MFGFLFGIVIWVLRLIAIAVLVYCVLSFLAPTSKVYTVLKQYVEPVLKPIRDVLYKQFPKLESLSFDITPIALIIIIEIVVWLLDLI